MIQWGCRHPCSQPKVNYTGYRYCQPCFALIEGLTLKRERQEVEEDEVLVPSSQPERTAMENVKRVETIEDRELIFDSIEQGDPRYFTLPILQQVVNHFQSGAYDRLAVEVFDEQRQTVLELVCGTFARLSHEEAQRAGTKWVSIPVANDNGTVYWAHEPVIQPWGPDRRKDYTYFEEEDDDGVIDEDEWMATQRAPPSQEI